MHESADARPARAVAAARRRPRRGHRGSVAFLPAARRSCITLRTRCVAQPPTSRGLCVRNRTARRLSSSTASRFAGSAPQARTLLLRCADSLSRRGGVPPGGRRSGMPPTRGGGGGSLGCSGGGAALAERRRAGGAELPPHAPERVVCEALLAEAHEGEERDGDGMRRSAYGADVIPAAHGPVSAATAAPRPERCRGSQAAAGRRVLIHTPCM